MKRKWGLLLLTLTLLGTNTGIAQSPSQLFSDDYQGESRPFTYSGFQNRWIETMMAEYNLSPSDLKTEEMHPYFELEEELKVAFEESFISEDRVIFKLSILNNEKTDFETIMNLVRMFDTEIDEATLREIHEDWLTTTSHYATNQVGDHLVDTYNKDVGIGDAFIVRFTYPLTMFQNGEYPNLIESLHDANDTPPDIYADEETDETVYVNRLYLNRILNQLSQDFDWDLSEKHVKTAGGTVYYYPQELAEIGRVNEIYLFSGPSSRGEIIELRFTNDAVEGEQSPFVHQKLNAYYFHYFARLLDPELSQAEMTEAYTNFIENAEEEKEDFILGSLKIKRNGYTSNTFSLSRIMPLEDEVDDSATLLTSQELQALVPEDVLQYPNVEIVAPSDLIYEKASLSTQVVNANSAIGQELEEKIQTLYETLPTFGEQLTVTGDVVEWNAPILILTTQSGVHYRVHVEGEVDLTVGQVIDVTGTYLGMQETEDLNLSLIAESIQSNGQELLRRGGVPND